MHMGFNIPGHQENSQGRASMQILLNYVANSLCKMRNLSS